MCCATERSDASSVSTALSYVDIVEHNVWNPMKEIPSHVQTGGIFEILVEEIYLERIALSCNFALGLLSYKEGDHDFA